MRRVLAEVDLTDRAHTKVRKLSGGMRQRLALAQALLGDPDLIILDEPTVGLDPEQRMRFRALLSKLGASRTVLLSTHQTEDVATLCERVVVMKTGSVVFEGTPGGLASPGGRAGVADDDPAGGDVLAHPDGRYRTLGLAAARLGCRASRVSRTAICCCSGGSRCRRDAHPVRAAPDAAPPADLGGRGRRRSPGPWAAALARWIPWPFTPLPVAFTFLALILVNGRGEYPAAGRCRGSPCTT